jgi:hypothetical protein
MKTPVAFIIFNRPDTTEKVFEAIRQAKPPKLLVVADGPRTDRPGEAEKCAATRAIINRVDWECEVFTNFSDINLGCKKRVSSGIDWIFNTVEEAIVLEDDCLPHPTFFEFCEQMLDYYRDDERIMSIAGDNAQFGRKRSEYSYYFSRYFHCWGWASWRRAWKHYDIEMKKWPQVRESDCLNQILLNDRAVEYWIKIFNSTYNNKFNTWDYQWLFAQWVNNGLTVVPNTNLISNIGFGMEATNTKNSSDTTPYANRIISGITFPLKHPQKISVHKQADAFTQETRFNPSFFTRARFKMHRVLGITHK